MGVILTASSNGVETGLQIAYFEVHTDLVRSLMLVLMEFSFSKTDFKSRLRATGSMMSGNACVAFLILGNRNWGKLGLTDAGRLDTYTFDVIDV